MAPTLLEQAETLAEEAHAGHARKGGDGGTPYVRHLRSVAQRLRSFGYTDEPTLAAALLHDLLEDRPAFGERLRATMSAEVVATVEALTEPRLDAAGAALAKEPRVLAYLDQLGRTVGATRRALPISCADKIDNLLDLLDAERRGESLLLKLHTRPGQQLRHLASLRALYAPAVNAGMLEAFDAAVGAFQAHLARWLPGRAIALAAEAHLGQFDRAGAPYILHPLRLLARAATEAERTVAVLHDVVEDTPWTLEALREEGFPEPVLAALDRLTRRPHETYEEFVGRILDHRLACRVKLLDLEDNLSVARLERLEADDLARIEKYHRARARVLHALAGFGGEPPQPQ